MPVLNKSVFILLISASIAGAVDPVLLDQVMPEAKVFVGINFAGISMSPLGQMALAQSEASSEQLKALTRTVGFDPLKDMREILIASTGEEKDSRSLVLLRGTFPKIEVLAKATGAAIRSYKGIPVLSMKEQTSLTMMALLDASTIAVGDQKSVQAAIDRRGVNVGLDSRLVARVQEMSRQYDFWMVGKVPEGASPAASAQSQQLGGLMQGDIVKSVVEFGGGVKLGSELTIAAEAVTKTEKDAAALADVVKFFIGMAQMSAQKDPKAANSMAFLQKLNLRAEGNVAKMSLTIPAAEMEKVVQAALSQALQQAVTAAPSVAAPARKAPVVAPPGGGLIINSSPRDMGTVIVK
jgi:hypothetical protein